MDLLDLYASLTLDDTPYERALDGAENAARDAAKTISSSLGGGARAAVSGVASAVGGVIDAFGSLARSAGTIGAAGLGAASAAATGLGKAALDAYGDFEQLAGGIETLFGEGSEASRTVRAFADTAYERMQMSANDYMQSVTDFSANLMQTLSKDDAAKKADQALSQIADNANKMGSAAESIKDAYKGLSKQNATMLDNLKLGYGGTAAELARLVNDSGVLGDVEATAKNVWDVASFDKIIDAIGVMQERLGMAGVSSEEALHTIQGSINMTKAAWQNLLAGFGNPDADLGALTDNLLTSIDAVADNALPAIERIMTSAGDAVSRLAPQLAGRLSDLLTSVVPSLTKAAVALVKTVGNVALDTVPQLLDMLGDAIDGARSSGFADGLAEFIERAFDVLASRAPRLIEGYLSLVSDLFGKLFARVASNPAKFAKAGADIIKALIRGISTGAGMLVRVFGELVSNIAANPREFASIGADIIKAIADGVVGGVSLVGDIVMSIAQSIRDNPEGFVQAGAELLSAVVDGIKAAIAGVSGIFDALLDGDVSISSVLDWSVRTAKSLLAGLADALDAALPGFGIAEHMSMLLDGVDGFTPESIAAFCSNAVGLLAAGLAPALESAIPAIGEFVSRFAAAFTDEENQTKIAAGASSLLDSLTSGIRNAAPSLKELRTAVFEVVGDIGKWITDEENLKKISDTADDLLVSLGDGLDKDVEKFLKEDVVQMIESLAQWIVDEGPKFVEAGGYLLANLLKGIWNGFVTGVWKLMADAHEFLGDSEGAQQYYDAMKNSPFLLRDEVEKPSWYGNEDTGAAAESQDRLAQRLEQLAARMEQEPRRTDVHVEIDGREVGRAATTYQYDVGTATGVM